MSDKKEQIAVLGAGTMGRGIVQVFAAAGYSVRMFDVASAAIESATKQIHKMLDRAVEKGRMEADVASGAKGRIAPAMSLSEIGTCDLIVEAATEKPDIKTALLKDAQAHLAADGILASNTSSISITRLAAATDCPERFIGMHFFNPVPLMKLVEVVAGLQTSDATVERTLRWAETVGKTAVKCNDHPGFVSNRVLMPMINEAIFALQDGVADAQGIDDIMRLGMNYPMGPLALADLIGLDVCLFIIEVMHRDLGEDRYRPCPLLRKLVAAGRLGKKTGQGFHQYT